MKNKQRKIASEAIKLRWQHRITLEKGYDDSCACWMAERIYVLIDHMQYGHALIAYRRQDGEFCLLTATLIYYERDFHRKYNLKKIRGTIAFWCVEKQNWCTFCVENFLEWKPVV